MVSYLSSSGEVLEKSPEIAVFGVGAVEQHGSHLPIGTDLIQVSALTHEVARKIEGFLIPPLPYSMSECHGEEPGTHWLKPATLSSVVEDVAYSVLREGINKMVLVNGHGGNFVLSSTVQELKIDEPDLKLLFLELAELVPQDDIKDSGIHAGASETSLQLYLNGENVKGRPEGYVPPVGREFLDYTTLLRLSREGIWGDPRQGSKELGEKIFRAAVENCLEEINTKLNYPE